jgi:hypothetical protein
MSQTLNDIFRIPELHNREQDRDAVPCSPSRCVGANRLTIMKNLTIKPLGEDRQRNGRPVFCRLNHP